MPRSVILEAAESFATQGFPTKDRRVPPPYIPSDPIGWITAVFELLYRETMNGRAWLQPRRQGLKRVPALAAEGKHSTPSQEPLRLTRASYHASNSRWV